MVREPVRGLLARIASGARTTELNESVLANVSLILNTRIGDAPSAPDLGMIDLTDAYHQMPEAIPALVRSIKTAIGTFEPRLKNLNVRPIPTDDPLTLGFEISARLDDRRRTLIRVSTSLDGHRRVHVG